MNPEPKINILLVDDNPDKLLSLEAVLDDLGQNLIKANSGSEALRLLLREDFALILLDVKMPGMDGFETAALIRQRQRSTYTPIIFVTAFMASDPQVYKAYSLGAVDCIFTPIVPAVLRSKVSVFVELYKKTEEVKVQAGRLREIEEKAHRTQLHAAEERLELETKRNRFFTLALDMLSIAGFDGYFKQMNPTWEKVLGLNDRELKSKPFLDFVHPEDRDITTQQIERLKAGASHASFENRYRAQDGSWRWLAWTAAAFAEEELLYFFARDITDRKQSETEISSLNQALRQRAEELETTNSVLEKEIAERVRAEAGLQESNTALESFSYTVAHDLRAPLRAMHGFAGILVQDYGDCLDAMGKDCAERIRHSAARLDSLIYDLLNYSRLNRTDLNLQPIFLEEPIDEALLQLGSQLSESQAQVIVDKPLPKVWGHQAILSQVLTNLVANAIKFMPPGKKPLVRIRAEPRNGQARIWVEDNGIGISPEYHEKIFGVFERLHNLEYPGNGIGLAIVQQGVKRLGGKVGLESNSGQGSRFWFELNSCN